MRRVVASMLMYIFAVSVVIRARSMKPVQEQIKYIAYSHPDYSCTYTVAGLKVVYAAALL